MKLTAYEADRKSFLDKGYELPRYDRAEMIKKTKAEPTWLHFGAGNIFPRISGRFA